MKDATRDTVPGSRSRNRRPAQRRLPESPVPDASGLVREDADRRRPARRSKEGHGRPNRDFPTSRRAIDRRRGHGAAFRHILIPASDDPGSRRAFEYGVEVAARFGARVTGFHAASPFVGWTRLAEPIEDAPKKSPANPQGRAAKALAPLKRLCGKAGIDCRLVSEPAENPAEAIVAQARKLKCDLIVMASHGRAGITRLVLGSETRNVLDRCSLPVLVVR